MWITGRESAQWHSPDHRNAILGSMRFFDSVAQPDEEARARLADLCRCLFASEVPKPQPTGVIASYVPQLGLRDWLDATASSASWRASRAFAADMQGVTRDSVIAHALSSAFEGDVRVAEMRITGINGDSGESVTVFEFICEAVSRATETGEDGVASVVFASGPESITLTVLRARASVYGVGYLQLKEGRPAAIESRGLVVLQQEQVGYSDSIAGRSPLSPRKVSVGSYSFRANL